MPKTNIEYLREEIKKTGTSQSNYDDINEWIEAIEQEMEEIKTEKDDISQSEIDNLQSRIESLEEELEESINEEDLEEIDCGIGVIKYLQPDNIKLQIVMEELKEKMEHKAFHSA